MRVGEWYDCFEVDFNSPAGDMAARAPWGADHDWKVGQVVFAYTTDDRIAFGCLARIIELRSPETLHRRPGEPVPDYGLIILSRKAEDENSTRD